MPIHDLLLPEFDSEMKKTRTVLERLPEDAPSYTPHVKSMPLAKLGGHVAQLPVLLSIMLSTPEFNFASGQFKPYIMTTREDLLAEFDKLAAAARAQLAEVSDDALHENWKIASGDYLIYSGSRYNAVRSLFFNHIVHHRAQLGVYLRLNDIPVPSIYGPSADER